MLFVVHNVLHIVENMLNAVENMLHIVKKKAGFALLKNSCRLVKTDVLNTVGVSAWTCSCHND